MSFQNKNLSVLAYANNFTNWHYVTEDTLDTVMQPNYFAQAGSMLRKNDLMILNTKDHNSAIWVNHSDGNHVTVTKQSSTN
jgi:hypothetical protein